MNDNNCEVRVRQFGNIQLVITEVTKQDSGEVSEDMFFEFGEIPEKFNVVVNWISLATATRPERCITLGDCSGKYMLGTLMSALREARTSLTVFAEIHNNNTYLERQRIREVRRAFYTAHIYKEEYHKCVENNPSGAFGWKRLAVQQIVKYSRMTKRDLNPKLFVESRLVFPMELRTWR